MQTDEHGCDNIGNVRKNSTTHFYIGNHVLSAESMIQLSNY